MTEFNLPLKILWLRQGENFTIRSFSKQPNISIILFKDDTLPLSSRSKSKIVMFLIFSDFPTKKNFHAPIFVNTSILSAAKSGKISESDFIRRRRTIRNFITPIIHNNGVTNRQKFAVEHVMIRIQILQKAFIPKIHIIDLFHPLPGTLILLVAVGNPFYNSLLKNHFVLSQGASLIRKYV